jgi:hypothetical protein
VFFLFNVCLYRDIIIKRKSETKRKKQMLNIIQVLRFEDANDANNVRTTNRTFGEQFTAFDTGDLERRQSPLFVVVIDGRVSNRIVLKS